MATEERHYPIFDRIPRDEALDEIEKAKTGETWRVYYFCTVCGAYTFAQSGSERRLSQMCPACLGACHVRVRVDRRLAERVTKKEWRAMMDLLESKMGEMVEIVRETVAASRYNRLYGAGRKAAKREVH